MLGILQVRCEIKRQTAGFQNFFVEEMKSSGRESLATSIEVLTGNSTGVVSIQGEASSVCTKQQYKLKPPLFKPKVSPFDLTRLISLFKTCRPVKHNSIVISPFDGSKIA